MKDYFEEQEIIDFAKKIGCLQKRVSEASLVFNRSRPRRCSRFRIFAGNAPIPFRSARL